MGRKPQLPPVISTLLSGPAPPGDFVELKRWFRYMLPELRRQAEWTSAKFKYQQPKPDAGSFFATPSAGIDPSRSTALCSNHECRLKTARQFARTVGLYADHIVLADELTSKLLTLPRFSDEQIYRFAIDVSVLHEIAPLINGRFVSFRELTTYYCAEHFRIFKRAIRQTSADILAELNLRLPSRAKGDALFVELDELFGYSLLHVEHLTPRKRAAIKSRARRLELIRKIALSDTEHLVGDTALALRDAVDARSTLLSGSKVSMLALRRLEGSDQLEDSNWEAIRSAELPWIQELSVSQIVALRQAAPEALDRLRVKFANTVAADAAIINTKIEELRQEAEEVRAKLALLKKSSDTLFRNVSGVLGLTIAVYGFSYGFVPPAAAFASLMTLLGLLHGSKHGESVQEVDVKSKPGYVLLKAKELLGHAEPGDAA